MKLKAPFPWFGGKSRAAPIIWPRFGRVRNYVEPFAGSLAVLLAREEVTGTETVNDLDCYVANFWRALAADPAAVAQHADHPVNEADLHARHLWLVNQVEFRERMKTDPEFFDVRVAGWWVWGISCWIGGGWCVLRDRVERKRPIINADRAGNGIHCKIPQLHPKGGQGVTRRQVPRIDAMCNTGANNSPDLQAWFHQLANRLRRTRVVCGDWSRVLGDTPLGLTSNVPPGFRTAVLLDPPYHGDVRDPEIYATDSSTISTAVRAWAIEHGDDPRLRIALCGYEDEHTMPDTWECVPWKAAGGYGNRTGNLNSHKERIWFSPHCLRLDREPELFAMEAAHA